ncbi:MAG: hypothetical protein H7288_01260, partial [Kineosporiaceae bacterium]|nr:hypothetical protein [Aeromicrobium sp.]
MTKVKDPQALAILEQRMVATFDVGYEEYIAGTALHIIPTAYFNTSKKIVETSGILEMVGQWDTERRKSRAGKKAFLPLPALVVLYLLNAQMGVGVTYRELARTVTHRLSSAQRSALGIRSSGVESVDLWYSRISETSYRLIALMNPRPTPLRKILGDEAYRKLLERMDTDSARRLAERNQVRIDQFCNALVEASLRQLPKDIWNRYTGNVAIDATKVHIRGGLNSASPVGRRSNPDSLAGRYRREGNHDGLGAKTDAPAYEAETSVMLWNGPGENTLFPSLITVISCHNPGRLRGHAAAHMARHKALGFNHFTVVVDRAYNGEKIENFHLPAARLGLDVVFDYKQVDLGTQSLFEDLILVDGSWYVGWMPQALIDVTKEFRVIDREITDAKRVLYDAEHTVTQGTSPAALELGRNKERQAATHLKEIAETLPSLEERLKMREPYRMIPKGRRSVDGFQRFSYP